MQILKDNIRSRILDVAKQQFELKGYSKTSMREIAVDVGVGVGNIYNYFKVRMSCFMKLFVRFCMRWKCCCRNIMEYRARIL